MSNFTFVALRDWPPFPFALVQINANPTSFHRCQGLLLSTLRDHAASQGAVESNSRANSLWVTASQHMVAGVSRCCHQLFLFLSNKPLSLVQSCRQDHRRTVQPKGQSKAGLTLVLNSSWQRLSQRLQSWLLPVLSQGWLIILRQESAEICKREMLSFLQWISSGLFLSAPWFLQTSAYRNSWCWARQPWHSTPPAEAHQAPLHHLTTSPRGFDKAHDKLNGEGLISRQPPATNTRLSSAQR